MDAVNDWTGALLGAIGVIAAGVAAARWLVTTLTKQMRVVAAETVAATVGPLEARLDGLETKVDHLAEVVDLRIRPLESDMALIKQHLLGSPAA